MTGEEIYCTNRRKWVNNWMKSLRKELLLAHKSRPQHILCAGSHWRGQETKNEDQQIFIGFVGQIFKPNKRCVRLYTSHTCNSCQLSMWPKKYVWKKVLGESTPDVFNQPSYSLVAGHKACVTLIIRMIVSSMFLNKSSLTTSAMGYPYSHR